jgi:NTP pyrophosphatase (non-canonical NTP hydrolase)
MSDNQPTAFDIYPFEQQLRQLDQQRREDAWKVNFREMQRAVHQTSREKGWYDKPEWVQEALALPDLPDHIKKGIQSATDRNPSEMLMLVVTEIAEGVEGLRKDLMDDHLPERPMIECELADMVIRAMDFAEHFGYDLAGAIIAKAQYNKGRPVRHGGKKF